MMKLALLIAVHLLVLVGCGAVLACSNPSPAPTQPSTPATPKVAQYSNVQAMPAHGLYVTTKNLGDTSLGSSDDLSKLVEHSSLIVIGTVSSAEPTVVSIQDDTPSDSTSTVSNVKSVGNVYEVRVERYLKGGEGAESVSVVQFVGLNYDVGGQLKQTRSKDDDLLPVKNSRYILFLTEQVDIEGHWIGTVQPYKFLLTGGQAKAESPVGGLGGAFPEQSEASLISSVETKIAAGP